MAGGGGGGLGQQGVLFFLFFCACLSPLALLLDTAAWLCACRACALFFLKIFEMMCASVFCVRAAGGRSAEEMEALVLRLREKNLELKQVRQRTLVFLFMLLSSASGPRPLFFLMHTQTRTHTHTQKKIMNTPQVLKSLKMDYDSAVDELEGYKLENSTIVNKVSLFPNPSVSMCCWGSTF